MTTPEYERIAGIVAGAAGLHGEALAAYVAAACGADVALRAEVDALLAHADDVPGLLATGGAARAIAARGLMDADPADPAGATDWPATVGPYRILGLLGQGGMGTVYRAEQAVPIRREVALKLVRRGLDTDRIVARFAGERQTLALMDHPSIARVLDAGASEDGRPYFVMELVDGTPITAMCEARRLATTERLRLFLAVCAAVQHAHQKGVIHRDLKPSNVLVREQDGQLAPRIIDFGIAKAIEGDSRAGTLLTIAGDVMGTPEYMSPEQAGAIDGGVDTRADVYSLGVILYELLAGRRPYTFATATGAEIQRVLAQVQPARPSAAPSGRRRELVGDLDNIVLKALAKSPADRYGSVEQLADDLRRHLDGLPVVARAATWRYRGGKFLRRHWAGAVASVALLLLLGGAAAVLAVQASRLAAERDRAVAAEQRARAEAETSARVTEFMVDVFEVTDPSESRGNSVTVREVLDRGASRLETQLAEQPEVRATLQDAIGRVYQNLGLPQVAETLIEQALAGRRALFGDDHAAVGESLDHLARLQRELGTGADVEAAYRQALAIKQRTLGETHPSVALTLNNLANAVRDRGDFASAEALARQSLEMRRALLGAGHAEVAESLHDLGGLLFLKGDAAGAEQLLREAVAIDRRIHGEVHPVVAIGLNTLGQALLERGDVAGAERELRASLELVRRMYPYRHRETAMSIRDVGAALVARQQHAEGEALLREALSIHEGIVGRRSEGVWHVLLRLGRSRQAQGDLAGAEVLFREYLSIGRGLYGDDDARTARGLVMVAGVTRLRGRLDEAEQLAARAVEVLRGAVGTEHRSTALALEEQAAVAHARGRLTDAEAQLLEVVRIRRAVLPALHPEVGTGLVRLGTVRLEAGQPAGAVVALQEARDIRRAAVPRSDAAIAEVEGLLQRATAAGR